MKDIKTVGSRASVFHGNAKHTSGGLEKRDLKMSKNGSIVSKKNSARAKRRESPLLKLWRQSVSDVYKLAKYRGKFVPIKKGTPFYKAVKKEYSLRIEDAGYSGSGKKKTKSKTKRRIRNS